MKELCDVCEDKAKGLVALIMLATMQSEELTAAIILSKLGAEYVEIAKQMATGRLPSGEIAPVGAEYVEAVQKIGQELTLAGQRLTPLFDKLEKLNDAERSKQGREIVGEVLSARAKGESHEHRAPLM